jgi:acetyl-CoA carboxylase carboxyl transferase subunit alpha
MLEFGLIDGIVKEPIGGAHNAPEEIAKTLKKHIKAELDKLNKMDPEERITVRINKYAAMGRFERRPIAEKIEKTTGK